jgi:soluble lytic murein transglycosylase
MTRTLALLAVLTLPLAAAAMTPALRGEFERAYAAAREGRDTADSEALRGYLLFPYVQQARLQHRLLTPEAGVDAEIEAFLETHDKTAVTNALRPFWYASLAQRQQWERLANNYRDIGDATLQCHSLTARLRLQKLEGLQAAVSTQWSNAAGSLPACEAIFEWLKTTAAWTPALVESRVRLALKSSNAAFARQLLPLLSSEAAAPFAVWATFLEQPRKAIDDAIAKPRSAIESDALLAGWVLLSRNDMNAAMQRYQRLVSARALSPATAQQYALELALALSWSRRPEALTYFAKVPIAYLNERNHENGFEWNARALLWAGEWERAAKLIAAMPVSLRGSTKWRYWGARTTDRLGNSADAKAQYRALLKDDNYYAALAAARLGEPYTPVQLPVSVDEALLSSVATQPSLARAGELRLMNNVELRNLAYDEWRNGYAQLNATERLQAIVLASRWRWHDQAILTAAQQRVFDDYALLYPRPYDDEVRAAAEHTGVAPVLIYALLRQESLYRADAVSSANAQGLMQLLPETARRTVRQSPSLQKHIKQPLDLHDANTNIHVGAALLRSLINRFNGLAPLALAGYNAGPGAAERWRPSGSIETDIWIENIPYNETRTYVQRVLWHSVVFAYLADGKAHMTSHWLTRVRPAVQR